MFNVLEKITVNPHSDVTLAGQIKQQVTWLAASGQLKPGDRLPSIRQMARRLSINLHTVRNAYQKLESAGLVETRQGFGTRLLPYDPVRMARVACTSPSHAVGVILPSLSNPFYHAFLKGVQEVADQDQTLLFMCCTYEDRDEALRYIAQLSARQVDGMIVVSHNVSHLLPSKTDLPSSERWPIPLVAVDSPAHSGYSVQIDLESAGYQATQHLLAHGHSRVGLISFDQEAHNVQPILLGYRRALREAGFEVDSSLMAQVRGFDMAAGEEGTRMLMAIAKPPSAIFAIADTLAIGAWMALRSMGLHIPQDIALVGFNDIPLARLVNPPLTTVAAPAGEAGTEAMKMLRSLALGERPARRQVILPTSLVVRQSCGSHPLP